MRPAFWASFTLIALVFGILLALRMRLEKARALLAELRLAFQLVPDAEGLHGPFLELNAEIAELVEDGDAERAASRMAAYLDRAEEAVLAAMTGG